MSTFEDDRYQWRETYFVLFDPSKRPKTHAIQKGLKSLFSSLEIRQSQGDAEGRIEVLRIASQEDFAALDIVYQSGEHVFAEMQHLAEELRKLTSTKKSREKIDRAKTCHARLEVLHFEQMVPIAGDIPVPVRETRVVPEPKMFQKAKAAAEMRGGGPFAKKPRFQFDPKHYIEIPEVDVPDPLDEQEVWEFEQAGQLDPNTLILILQLLCRLTDGVAIDPASGVVL